MRSLRAEIAWWLSRNWKAGGFVLRAGAIALALVTGTATAALLVDRRTGFDDWPGHLPESAAVESSPLKASAPNPPTSLLKLLGLPESYRGASIPSWTSKRAHRLLAAAGAEGGTNVTVDSGPGGGTGWGPTGNGQSKESPAHGGSGGTGAAPPAAVPPGKDAGQPPVEPLPSPPQVAQPAETDTKDAPPRGKARGHYKGDPGGPPGKGGVPMQGPPYHVGKAPKPHK
jgi:hypothetical protein